MPTEQNRNRLSADGRFLYLEYRQDTMSKSQEATGTFPEPLKLGRTAIFRRASRTALNLHLPGNRHDYNEIGYLMMAGLFLKAVRGCKSHTN